MPDKMLRFSHSARLALSLAQDESEYFQHATIGVDHLLLGLLVEADGIGGRALRASGVGYNTLRDEVERLHRPGGRTPHGTIDLSAGVKRTLEQSVNEARILGHQHIGTEHLLLALLRLMITDRSAEFSVPKQILHGMNVRGKIVREEVMRILAEPPAQSPEPSEQADLVLATERNANIRVDAYQIVDHIQAGLAKGQTLADLTLNELISLMDEHLGDVPDELVNTARRLVLVGIINRIFS